MTRAIPWTICLAAVCLAQTPGIPGLGWIAGEEPGRYQRVAGIAGAALLDSEVQLAPGRLIAVRPGSPVAVSVSEEGAVSLVKLEAAADESAGVALEGAVEAPAVAAWSPSGDALLLAGGGRIQIWRTDAGGPPSLRREFPFEAEAAAVSDGGARVLARAEGALYLLDEDGAIELVSAGPAGAFTFLAGSPQFAWIENSALRFGGAGAPPDPAEIDDAAESNKLLASAGSGQLLLTETKAGQTRVRMWRADGTAVGEWWIPAEVTDLEPTGAQGVVRLGTRSAGPVWLADLAAVEPLVFFVPRGGRQALPGGEQ